MSDIFSSIHNYQERAVRAAIGEMVNGPFAHVASNGDFLSDVACVALNRLPPRYIRHEVDFAFYLSDKERAENDAAINEAVRFAFEFVQARVAMRARR